jgi:redox-sensitive bicupin YhaK (pirin superfamily)
MAKGGKFNKSIPVGENVFFYVVRGEVKILGEKIPFRNLVEFTNDGGNLSVEAFEDSVLILGHAKPFNEPMVAQGPFVMNTQQEIMEAYRDYQQGKFGTWKH